MCAPPSAYTNGVVTPHAAFLGLRFAPRATVANVRRLASDFPGLYGRWGFRDSVNVDSGRVSDFYLSLDQGMIMAALGNALTGDKLRGYVSDGALEKRRLLGERDLLDLERRDRAILTPLIHGRQSGPGVRLDPERRIAHAERLQDPGRHEGIERLLRHDGVHARRVRCLPQQSSRSKSGAFR